MWAKTTSAKLKLAGKACAPYSTTQKHAVDCIYGIAGFLPFGGTTLSFAYALGYQNIYDEIDKYYGERH